MLEIDNGQILAQTGTGTMNDTGPLDESESRKSHMSIAAAMGAKLNLADFQNAVPILRELSVVNDTTENLAELDLLMRPANR